MGIRILADGERFVTVWCPECKSGKIHPAIAARTRRRSEGKCSGCGIEWMLQVHPLDHGKSRVEISRFDGEDLVRYTDQVLPK